MKKNLLILIFMPFLAQASTGIDSTDSTVPGMPVNDGLFFNLTLENLREVSPDIDIKTFRSRGFEIGYIYPLQLPDETLGLGIGLQLSFQNIHSNLFSWELDSAGNASDFLADNEKYKKNKLGNTYLEVPFELRFKTRPGLDEQSFKISAGFKTGYLLSSYTKFKDEESKYRFVVDNIEDFRYGLTGRIGYGRLCLYGFYGLNDVFKKDEGIPVQPYSIGVTYFFF